MWEKITAFFGLVLAFIMAVFLGKAKAEKKQAEKEVKAKEEQIKKAAGAEDLVLSARKIGISERAGRSIYEIELGKYSDAISHTWSLQTKKQLELYLKHYIY